MTPTILVVDDNAELVAILSSLFEEAGYTVIGAHKGKTAVDLVRGPSIQAAVLDVLLPDMMGYQVAEALRAQSPKASLVFMSGVFKGSRHSAEAVTRFPGALHIEKPFEAKVLLERIKALVPPGAAPVAKSSSASGAFEVELDIDVEDDEQDSMELTGRIKVTGGGNISADLQGASLTAGKPTRGPISGPRPSSPSALIDAVQAGISRPARQGQLTDNLPGLISAFYLSKETGELYCQKGKVKKVVYFEGGTPVFALSNLAADRFGQFLVRVGKIKSSDLDDAALVASQTGRRTGDVLVERGLLKDTERLYYVGQQVKSIIYSLFGWEEGQFVVTFREKARSEVIKLDVFPGNLIVRGVKKLYKPERLTRLVRPEVRLMPNAQPPYQLHELELDKWEAQLLTRIDGTRTNAEIVAAAGKPEHVVLGFLAAMLGVGVIEKPAS